MLKHIIDLVYPRRCPLCMNIIGNVYKNGYICARCRTQLPYIAPPFCLKCGKHIGDEEQEYCSDCQRHPKSFERGFPVFSYEGKLKDSVWAFKYKNKREFAESYAEEIMRCHGETLLLLEADALIPVPVHASRYRRRGYNQAELLAEALALRLGLPVYGKELVRVSKTHVQKDLNDKERYNNLKNAFKRQENSVKLDTVILVDDIYTSGATIEACTNVLKGTGVSKIYYTSICIGQGS